MKYQFIIHNNSLEIAADGMVILEKIYISMQFVRSYNPVIDFVPYEIKTENNAVTVEFKRAEPRNWQAEAKYVRLRFYLNENSLYAKFEAEADTDAAVFNYLLAPENTAKIHFEVPQHQGKLLSFDCANPFWFNQKFSDKAGDFYPDTQSVMYNAGGINTFLVTLSSSEGFASIHGNAITVNTFEVCRRSISSTLFMLAADKNAQRAVDNCFDENRALYISPKRTEKTFPKQFENFGWCTWDAFYRDVNEQSILEKAEEFKQKGIKTKWIIIDDGWSMYEKDTRKLLSFKEDKTKFPHGLKWLTEKLKGEYGIEYVGVWHAFTAYWDGVSKNGEIYQNNKEMLYEPYGNLVFPGETDEKAFAFWDTWHTYLEECGVDFVKVDNQAAFISKFDYIGNPYSMLQTQIKALEASVKKHFNGAIINCMGMNMNLALNRNTAVNRNSGDFIPSRDESFAKHLTQNIYTAIPDGQIHVCDFDMFWTSGKMARVSSVLRAISGGPVYTSDKVGISDAEQVNKIVRADGTIPRFDNPLTAVSTQYYVDCISEGVAQKAINRKGESIVLGAFGVSLGKTSHGKITSEDIEGFSGEYIAHDFFEDRYFAFNEDTVLEFDLDYLDCKLISLYPVKEGVAFIGNGAYYNEAAGELKKVNAEEILSK